MRERHFGADGWKVERPGCGGRWVHRSGWRIFHCGHPTANYPYHGVRPDGTWFVGENGRGWMTLALAKPAVAAAALGAAQAADPNGPRVLAVYDGGLLGDG